MQQAPVRRPVFFIGMPRSGTTVLFEAFSRHPALAWPTNYAETHPQMPAFNMLRRLLDNQWITLVGKKGQYVRVMPGNRYLPQPSEAYAFWNRVAHPDFARTYMRHVVVDDEDRRRIRDTIRQLMQLQKRPRFAAKFTGPPRIRATHCGGFSAIRFRGP